MIFDTCCSCITLVCAQSIRVLVVQTIRYYILVKNITFWERKRTSIHFLCVFKQFNQYCWFLHKFTVCFLHVRMALRLVGDAYSISLNGSLFWPKKGRRGMCVIYNSLEVLSFFTINFLCPINFSIVVECKRRSKLRFYSLIASMHAVLIRNCSNPSMKK